MRTSRSMYTCRCTLASTNAKSVLPLASLRGNAHWRHVVSGEMIRCVLRVSTGHSCAWAPAAQGFNSIVAKWSSAPVAKAPEPAFDDATGLEAVVQQAQRFLDANVVDARFRMSTLLAADDEYHHHKFKVGIFSADGKVRLERMTGHVLGIARRDMPIFRSGRSASGSHAAILLRDGRILLRTELVRAIIMRDKVMLFECRRPAMSERVGAAVLHAVRSHLLEPAKAPFELRQLEVLLDQTVLYMEDKASQIRMLSRVVQDDINRRVNSADIKRMLPLQRAVTGLEYDFQDMSDAIQQVASNDARLALLCLSEDQNLGHHSHQSWTPHMALASRLLMASDARIRSLLSELRELTEHLDSTREVWHMQLDAMRNRIIRVNLHLEFASISAMLAMAPAAFFGMNLLSGLEEQPYLLWHVSAACSLTGLATFGGLVVWHSWWPMRATKQRISDMAALQELLMHHVDEVGDVVRRARSKVREKGSKIDKAEFTEVVEECVRAHSEEERNTFSRDELELLYRILDTNKDGSIDVGELAAAHVDMLESSSHSNGDSEAR